MTQTASELRNLMQQAWTPKLLEGMGPKQKDLLAELAARKSEWTVDELENLLLMVKYDVPEELVDLSRSWDQPQR